MSGCCDPTGYRRFFNTKEANRAAREYRRKGLDGTALHLVDALGGRLDGATVIEGGAGTGGSYVEMLRRGATSAIAIDLSDAYLPAADAIAVDQGVADRVDRRVGDFVDLASQLPPADIVYLNRVVCCYPNMPAMLDAAVDRSRGAVALSYPRRRWFVRLGIDVLNRYLRWRSVGFQVFVHDPAEIDRRLRSAGMQRAVAGKSTLWHWAVWEHLTQPSGHEATGSGAR